MPQLAIVADDLTGAADTGACFAAAGLATVIPLLGVTNPAADVIVLSTESRDIDAGAAARAVGAAVTGLVDGQSEPGPRWIYKKIDSALRGHPRDELLSVMAAAGARCAVVAPAFPAEGRTTVGGRQHIDGVPVEASRFGGPGAVSDLLALFANGQGAPVRLLELTAVRTRPDEIRERLDDESGGIVVADAETDADLMTIGRAVSGSPMRILCGAAGFARQLAHALPLIRSAAPINVAPDAGPILVVAGSQHAATARQVIALRQAGMPIVCPSQGFIDDPWAPIGPVVAEVAALLAAGRSPVLTTVGLAPSALAGRSIAARLAQVVAAPEVRRQVGGLVLTGGDIAAEVCAALGATALWLGGEISPGLPWGVLAGGALPGTPIATKAGSFGGDDALLACIGHLTSGINH